MNGKIHFTYKSPENFTRLLCNIYYEQTHTGRENFIYRERFKTEPDSLFLDFMTTLYPKGITIGQKQIEELCSYIDIYLDNDEKAKDIKAKYDMIVFDSYVYFDIDKKVYPCSYCSHSQTIKNICADYFKGFDKSELSVEMIHDFIVKHFVVKSMFSTAESIANDSFFIRNCIIFGT